MLHSTKSTNIS